MRHALALAICLAGPAGAEGFVIDFPVACDLGATCHIQQLVDHDPGPGAVDFACGTLVYDGHKGTDIALPTLADQARGVRVLAAAPGTVAGIRSDMPDLLQGQPGAPDVTDRDCGNGVLLRHADGWETQHCHMAEGSILVRPGDTVAAGDPLGLVGLSGRTQFPHLHVSVRRDGAVVDPFAPDGTTGCDAPPAATLWSDPPPVPPGGLIRLGFAAEVPDYDAIKAGTDLAPPAPGTPLVAWVHVFGGRAGDRVEIAIAGPAGEVITHSEALERTQAQQFRAAGRRAPPGGWAPGEYVARIRLIRDGAVLDAGETRLTLAP